jgi:hypothetical protein
LSVKPRLDEHDRVSQPQALCGLFTLWSMHHVDVDRLVGHDLRRALVLLFETP